MSVTFAAKQQGAVSIHTVWKFYVVRVANAIGLSGEQRRRRQGLGRTHQQRGFSLTDCSGGASSQQENLQTQKKKGPQNSGPFHYALCVIQPDNRNPSLYHYNSNKLASFIGISPVPSHTGQWNSGGGMAHQLGLRPCDCWRQVVFVRHISFPSSPQLVGWRQHYKVTSRYFSYLVI